MKEKVKDYYEGLLKEEKVIKQEDKKWTNTMMLAGLYLGLGYLIGKSDGFKKGKIRGKADGYHDAVKDIVSYIDNK